MILSTLDVILIEGFSRAGESFPAISACEAMKFGAAAHLLQFGSNPPVAVIEYEGRTYYHVTQEPAQLDVQKNAAARAREQRRGVINEARNLLKSPEMLPTEQPEGVLNSLHKVAYKLTLSVRKARSSGKVNIVHNYRRKRSQVKGLFSALSDRIIPNKSSDEEEPHGSVYSDPVDTPYVLSTQSKRPYELKMLIRNAIMNEFWTRTMRRPTHFPGCKPHMSSQPTVLISVNHITTNDDSKNKFATLPNEVPAPHSNDLQQQLQQLQAQMRQLQQQLQGREETTPTGGRPNHSFCDQPYRVNEQYARTGGRYVHQPRGRYDHEVESSSRQGSMRYHNLSYHPQYDRRTPSPWRGSPPRPYYNTRQPLVSPRFNSQVNQEWRRVSPNRGRRDTGGSHQEQSAAPTSARTRQEYQVHPQQVVQHPINAPPQVVPSSSSQHNSPLLPTPTVPSTTPYTPSVNKRKRENR
jgi:hypothetical protein